MFWCFCPIKTQHIITSVIKCCVLQQAFTSFKSPYKDDDTVLRNPQMLHSFFYPLMSSNTFFFIYCSVNALWCLFSIHKCP